LKSIFFKTSAEKIGQKFSLFISLGSIFKVNDYYPSLDYSVAEIVMDTKTIHHRKYELTLMPIMQVMTFRNDELEAGIIMKA